MDAPLRLADLLGGLSMVADLGFGLPPQEAMRSCVVTTAFARHLGLAEDEVRDAFYAALLMHIGCVGLSHETADAFGDEINLTRSVSTVNISDPKAVMQLIPALTRGMGLVAKASVAAFTVTRGAAWGRDTDRGVCEVARETARRLGLSPGTQRALYDLYEWWNGKGPRGVGGEDIDLVARVIMVAGDAAYFDDLGGAALVERLLQKRIGLLDPNLVGEFIDNASDLLSQVHGGDPRQLILDVEPTPVVQRSSADLVSVARVFGDAVDLKSPYFHGHAGRVCDLAVAAGESLGLDAAAVEQVRIAALLHDVGRAGVTDAIWEKSGPLTAAEWEQVRMHAYHSERILSASTALQPVARLAGLHHERLDGAGYHRNALASELSMPARTLAAADAFAAMTAARAHRPAMDADQAASVLSAEAAAGSWDGDAVAAILAAAGQVSAPRTSRPAGLSSREVEVLRLLAQGLTNREIAAGLSISRRTAEHHIQHIYAKVGVTTRAAAAVFGLEHGLLVANR